MDKNKFYSVLIVILCSVILAACTTKEDTVIFETENIKETITDKETIKDGGYIYVYISGQVKRPGVYRMSGASRVYQAIEKAGGFTAKAYREELNLAETMYDSQNIRVLSKKQYKKQSRKSDIETDDEKKGNEVNINTATVQELTQLPGIGNAKALAIVAYRDENGNFSSIEDIKKVSGVGEATFANIESMITVN